MMTAIIGVHHHRAGRSELDGGEGQRRVGGGGIRRSTLFEKGYRVAVDGFEGEKNFASGRIRPQREEGLDIRWPNGGGKYGMKRKEREE